jgi:Na+/melibiose symporter-like transporter
MWSLILAWFWLGLTIGVMGVASERGQSAIVYFFVALFFSPLIAIVILIALPDLRRERIEGERHQELLRALADGRREMSYDEEDYSIPRVHAVS